MIKAYKENIDTKRELFKRHQQAKASYVLAESFLNKALDELNEEAVFHCANQMLALKRELKELATYVIPRNSDEVRGYHIASRYGHVYLIETNDKSKVTVPIGQDGSMEVIKGESNEGI